MKALVTGSAGFIGSEVCRALDEAGWDVYGLDVAGPPPAWTARRDVRRWFPADTGRRWDVVVHCAAAVVSPAAKASAGGAAVAANLAIDAALFEWAGRARPRRVVYFSSSCAYPSALGAVPGRRLAEHDIEPASPRWPDGLYGWVKLTGELLSHATHDAGVPVSIVRPFSVYGPRVRDGFAVRGFAGQVARRADPIVIWGNDEQTRDYIHVEDVAAAVVAMIRKGVDGPVNLGTGEATSLQDLARAMASAASYCPQIKVDPDMPAGVPWLVADNARLRQFYEPRIRLRDVLHTFVT